MPYDHEAEVEAFMAAARMTDPERYAVVCHKYPVKSARQLRRIAEYEIPVGLHPERLSKTHQTIASVTDATFAELALDSEESA